MAEFGSDSSELGRLLTDFLEARNRGEQPDARKWAQSIDDVATRAEFFELVAEADRVFGSMPRQARAGDRLLDRYELIGELGAGGFGKVWRARDLHDDGRDVAVKMLNGLAVDADARSNLRRDRAALERVDHPGVVRILDFGDVDDAPFLVLEFVDGVTLREVLDAAADNSGDGRAEALPPVYRDRVGGSWWRFAAWLTRQLARTLLAAHDSGVLHRDIKPDNIMLHRDGRVVLLDFGLAGMLDGPRGSLTARLIGTVHYLAPEQCREQSLGRDVRIDIYQLGVVFYELLVGRPAVAPNQSIQSILATVLSGRIDPPRAIEPECPRALESICRQATQCKPEQRYASMVDLALDLDFWLAGKRLSRRMPAWPHATAEVVRKRLRAAGRVAAAVAVGVLAVTAAFWLWRGEGGGVRVQSVDVTPQSVRMAGEAHHAGVLFGIVHRRNERGETLGVLPLVERDSGSSGCFVDAGAIELEYVTARALTSAFGPPRWIVLDGAMRSQHQRQTMAALRKWLREHRDAESVPATKAMQIASRFGSPAELLGEGWAESR